MVSLEANRVAYEASAFHHRRVIYQFVQEMQATRTALDGNDVAFVEMGMAESLEDVQAFFEFADNFPGVPTYEEFEELKSLLFLAFPMTQDPESVLEDLN